MRKFIIATAPFHVAWAVHSLAIVFLYEHVPIEYLSLFGILFFVIAMAFGFWSIYPVTLGELVGGYYFFRGFIYSVLGALAGWTVHAVNPLWLVLLFNIVVIVYAWAFIDPVRRLQE